MFCWIHEMQQKKIPFSLKKTFYNLWLQNLDGLARFMGKIKMVINQLKDLRTILSTRLWWQNWHAICRISMIPCLRHGKVWQNQRRCLRISSCLHIKKHIMEFGGEKTTFYASRNDSQCYGHQSTFGFIGNRSQNNVSSRLSEFKKHCFI